jgi:hypothetical protein
MQNQKPSVLRGVLSLAAFCFLLWTLASPTFLDASSGVARKSLDYINQLSSRAESKITSMSLHVMR